MDPNPNSFPILSYVMSRVNSSPKSKSNPNPNPNPNPSFDVEQPQIQERRPPPQIQEVVSIMPHLTHPDLIASMTSAISEVSQARSVLRTLGKRPDHETVDIARSKIAEIDGALLQELESVILSPRPDAVPRPEFRARQAELEKAARARAEEKKMPYSAAVRMEEMHEGYEKLLREAEERLERMYRGHGKKREKEGKEVEDKEAKEEAANEEVIRILQDVTDKGKCSERLELAGRRLQSLPEAFGRMKGLIALDVSNNLLEIIPDSIAGLERLEELRVSSNLLVSLPDSIGLLLNLKILDVSGNQLTSLPDSISKCRSLVELNASYNALTYLPTDIGRELVNLQKLLVHLNKLRSLPTSVCEMRSLRILDAHFNELRGLPYAIGKLSNLESLNLSSNFSDLTELPPTFGDLMNLRELDLSNNQIESLPDTFGRLDNLTKFNVDQNPLLVPPVEIIKRGVLAVKEYMAKRWVDILIEEGIKNQLQEEPPMNAGWLTRSTSWLKNNVVQGVSGMMGSGERSPRGSYLDQQL